MSTFIRYLTDHLGNIILPRTRDTAITMGDGSTTLAQSMAKKADLGGDNKVLSEQLPAMLDTSINLTDLVKAALALTGDKTTADALAKLSGAALRSTTGGNKLVDMSGTEFTLPHAQIATGSYTGTGTYGSSNPITIPCSFTPKFVVIRRDSSVLDQYAGHIAFFINPATCGIIITQSSSSVALNDAIATWGASSLQFYNTNDAGRGMNSTGVRYDYVILG